MKFSRILRGATVLTLTVLAGALMRAPGPARAAAPALTPPAPEVLEEARAIVERMKANERGPYRRIAWFCNDGTVQPPEPYACREHGGGHQYAEYSADRQRLAQLGWPVGTIFTATSFEELFDADHRHLRLRQLPFERYLEQVDDGWVLRRARFYRGRVQVQDEEEYGRQHLLQLLDDPEWVDANLLLVRELVRTIPHHGGQDRTQRVRRLAEEIAAQDASFQRLRTKIHGAPGPDDIERVRRWRDVAADRAADVSLLARADSLQNDLERLLGESGRAQRLESARTTLTRNRTTRVLAERLVDLEERDIDERIHALASVIVDSRPMLAKVSARWRLELLDLSLDLEAELRQQVFDLIAGEEIPSRRRALSIAFDLVRAAHGVGMFSAREVEALAAPLLEVVQSDSLSTASYIDAVEELRRVGSWAMGTVQYTFAEPLVGFTALEPRAARFADDLLRSSVLLPLGELVRAIVLDADVAARTAHRVFGQSYAGLLGLNPGVATGTLRFLDPGATDAPAERPDEIVVLPTVVAELKPVAGVLALSEGNLLSHVQMLARNLGIPNASLTPFLAQTLREHEGERVTLVVGQDGRIVIDRAEALADVVPLEQGDQEQHALERVFAPRPDLTEQRLLPLDELYADLAGVVVGPKAANVGELARMFPGRVAPAVALPFGVFAAHLRAGEDPIDARLRRTITDHRDGALDEPAYEARLDSLRAEIEALSLDPALAESLDAVLARDFGPVRGGVFVRSDTNVEDLPQFTGAGLNRTVANVTEPGALGAAIARVWASPFTPRSMAWRARVLEDPEEVYVSVLVMKSVPAEKSGVLVTTDLLGRGEGFTVATSWGVGGAVDNESAETLILRPDGGAQVVSEAKSAYQRALRAAGGIEWKPAPMGRVLTDAECATLLAFVDEVGAKREPMLGADGRPLPWDIEFGFVDGGLQLFQIRPLVQQGGRRAQAVVQALLGPGVVEDAVLDRDAPVDGASWEQIRAQAQGDTP